MQCSLVIAGLVCGACGRMGFGERRGTDPDASSDSDAFGDAALPDAPSPYNLAFVTPLSFNGDLGGLAGADAKCDAAAIAAGLPGHYRAWLSTPTVDAVSRFAGARGWVRLDGRPFADSLTSLTVQNQVFFPIMFDANVGTAVNVAHTGTNADGTHSLLNGEGTCNGWTSASATRNVTVGLTNHATIHWTNAAGGTCAQMFPLYCLGTDYNRPLAIVPTAGRKAFVSKANWDPATGLAGGDALCRSEAGSAGLANAAAFKALLATPSASAASRFDDTLATWVRTDGVPLAPTARAYFDAVTPQTTASLDVHADGTYNDQLFGVAYTGALTPRGSGTNATTCASWTVNNASANVAFSDVAGSTLFAGYTAACNRWGGTSFVYCLEP